MTWGWPGQRGTIAQGWSQALPGLRAPHSAGDLCDTAVWDPHRQPCLPKFVQKSVRKRTDSLRAVGFSEYFSVCKSQQLKPRRVLLVAQPNPLPPSGPSQTCPRHEAARIAEAASGGERLRHSQPSLVPAGLELLRALGRVRGSMRSLGGAHAASTEWTIREPAWPRG